MLIASEVDSNRNIENSQSKLHWKDKNSAKARGAKSNAFGAKVKFLLGYTDLSKQINKETKFSLKKLIIAHLNLRIF